MNDVDTMISDNYCNAVACQNRRKNCLYYKSFSVTYCVTNVLSFVGKSF